MLPFYDDLSLAEAALHYAEHGYAVIPLHTILPSSGACSCGRPTCTSPAKHPLTANGLKGATTDEDTVRRWWQTWPSANIGVVTGSRSGNLIVLDFDGGKYDDDAFNKVQDLLGDLPLTSTGWTVKTGSGFHAWFQSDQARQIKNSASKLSPGVDIRGEGGYVVAPPSLHWTKANYAWNQTQALTLPVLPAAWVDHILALQSQPAPSPAAQPGQSQTIPQGQRNNDLTRIAGKLRHAGLEQAELEAALLKINQERCQPPLSDREVTLIAKSVSRYAPGDDQDWSGLTADLDDGRPTTDADPTIIQDFTFGLNFFDLEDMDMTLFEEGEQILHYLYPGELASLVAVPSAGKSTLILNTLLCMAAGRPFLPIFNGSAPRKSLYIDFENRPNRIQADLRKMRAIFTDDERETIKNNLFVAVDPKWNNSFFAITQPGCLDALAKWVRHRGIHLVVFDTMAQAADIADENNNAEIQRKIIRPLNQFAQKSNCAVLLVHHMGKKTHGEHEMFSSRGASSLTGAVRLQMNINHVRNQQGLIELTCSKVKGEKFKATVFEYDHDSRWFMEYTRPIKAKPKSVYDCILDMFKDDSVIIKTHEIKAAWSDEFGDDVVERALAGLVDEGSLLRPKKGRYKLAPQDEDSENPDENEDS